MNYDLITVEECISEHMLFGLGFICDGDGKVTVLDIEGAE